jgi:hypothetical protein
MFKFLAIYISSCQPFFFYAKASMPQLQNSDSDDGPPPLTDSPAMTTDSDGPHSDMAIDRAS